MEWKSHVVQLLEKRDVTQDHPFAELISKLKKYEEENKKLERKLEERPNIPIGSSSNNDHVVEDLQRRLNEANQKLVDLLSQQHSTNQRLLDLNEQVRAKEEEVKKLRETEVQLHGKISSQDETMKLQNDLLANKEITAQVLTDELQAIQLELVSRDEKVKELERDNKALLERWLQKLNDEKSISVESFTEEKKKSLSEEVSNIKIHDSEPDIFDRGNNVTAILPSKMRKKILAHESDINCVQTSHNGKFFATGSADRKIKIFESNTGNVRHTIRGSQQSVTCVEFSTGDDLILGASNDNSTRVWSIETGRPRHALTGHSSKVYTAKFSYDATRVISGSYDRTIKLYDLVKGYCVRTIFSFSAVNDLCLTDDAGNHVISGHLDGHIRFWDTKNGEMVNEIEFQQNNQITSVSLSPDSTQILTNCRDNVLKLIDLKMFQVVNIFTAENFKVGTNWSRACWSPDGKYVASGSVDGSVYIWDALTGKVAKILKEHGGTVNCVSWSPTGDYLVSADKDKHVVIWEP